MGASALARAHTYENVASISDSDDDDAHAYENDVAHGGPTTAAAATPPGGGIGAAASPSWQAGDGAQLSAQRAHRAHRAQRGVHGGADGGGGDAGEGGESYDEMPALLGSISVSIDRNSERYNEMVGMAEQQLGAGIEEDYVVSEPDLTMAGSRAGSGGQWGAVGGSGEQWGCTLNKTTMRVEGLACVSAGGRRRRCSRDTGGVLSWPGVLSAGVHLLSSACLPTLAVCADMRSHVPVAGCAFCRTVA